LNAYAYAYACCGQGLGREKSKASMNTGGISGGNSISEFVNAQVQKSKDVIEISVDTWYAAERALSWMLQPL
jgi:hypothetical protein